MKSMVGQLSAVFNYVTNNRDSTGSQCSICECSGQSAARWCAESINGRHVPLPNRQKLRFAQQNNWNFWRDATNPILLSRMCIWLVWWFRSLSRKALIIDLRCVLVICRAYHISRMFGHYSPTMNRLSLLQFKWVQRPEKSRPITFTQCAKVSGRPDRDENLNLIRFVRRCNLTNVFAVPTFAFSLHILRQIAYLGLYFQVKYGKGNINPDEKRKWPRWLQLVRYTFSIELSDIAFAPAATKQTGHDIFAQIQP